ncbi:unnamed protein product [Leptidea sinapis]|uniref:Anoctamin dimerisation domain-containing protein n=1 Tax=Leptidea sinapis TaxID=189913 RepID=A0A5E4QG64_9NEOP|nr:unnamed protein product [Leptidea sinapis]
MVLRDYSEILKLRMPMKECSKIRKGGRTNAILSAAMYMSKFSALKDAPEKTNSFLDRLDSFWESIMSKLRVDPELFPERKHRLTAIYSKDKEYLFDTSSDCFWTPSIRSRIVQFILDRKKFSETSTDDFAFGVARLIDNNVYSAAYPLHDVTSPRVSSINRWTISRTILAFVLRVAGFLHPHVDTRVHRGSVVRYLLCGHCLLQPTQ